MEVTQFTSGPWSVFVKALGTSQVLLLSETHVVSARRSILKSSGVNNVLFMNGVIHHTK